MLLKSDEYINNMFIPEYCKQELNDVTEEKGILYIATELRSI